MPCATNENLMPKHFYYYATSLLAGYVVLSLELLGFRLFAPYFGYSLYVFGSLIGLILFSLALGYALGGYCADKNMREQTFFKIVFAAGIYLIIIGFSSHILLALLAQMHITTGTLLATALFFALPMAVLAALSPYFIKILSVNQRQTVGISAGSIYAIGTIGSLIGTFLTSFYLIPTFGALATLFSNGILILCLSLPWITRRVGKRILMSMFALGSICSSILFYPQSSVGNGAIIAQTDSPYNHLEIVDYGKFLGLRTDQRNNLVYSTYPKDGVWEYQFLLYTLFAIPPLINNAQTSLLLGLGAGTLPLLHRILNPDLKITGLEIDPEIVRLGREYFDLDSNTNLTVIIEDARPFLARTHNLYDFIEIDLFWGGGEIPFYLASQEFFKLTAERLVPQGLVAMNIYDPSLEEIIAAPLINTIRSVYPYVYRTKAPHGSHFVLASKIPVDYQMIRKKIDTKSYDPKFLDAISYFEENTTPVEFKQDIAVFTDDRTPIEKLSYKAIFSKRPLLE
ncbi:MAG: spermine synthase [Parcubacteria group bacterium Gr01-1014_48]|nr:MAG: spermine synthase [Parcubacteria group bacterium Greene0416_14]TSC74103.1 MAG: spermine synthase [Parcubacteria group bacterium Gr01-1014_48]TSD00127.1 MAG: spermine synthase [Parcubacteria group bacterium Greene1014_15]TSD07707.1 MAG: spermine synthase [Parcubacteria group bacterium Greene0714_4]